MKELKDMTLLEKLKLFRELWDNISYDDISTALGDLSDADWIKLDDIIKGIDNSDNCSECGRTLTEEDFKIGTEYETDPSPASYDYIKGYYCTGCGHDEDF